MASKHKTVRTQTIQSPVIRGAYFYLHEKRTKDAQKNEIAPDKQKYEFLGLIPKTNKDPAQCKNYMLFANLAMSLIPQVPEWGGNYPSPHWPIKDGDAKAASNPKNAYMANTWVINFSSNYPPKVALLQNNSPTEIPARRVGVSDLYKSGDYCVVSTYAFSYDNQSRGVKFDMEGVCFVAAGEAIGTTGRTVDQMFEGLPAMAPMQPGPAPVQYAPMASPPVAPVAQGYAQPGPPAGAPMPPQPTAAYAGPPAAPVAPVPGQVGLPPLPR